MPARGNEKPDAESTVKAVQRRFSTPVPRVTDLDELNRYFRQRCQAERARTVQSLSGPFLIGTRFAEEQAAAAPLPNHRFDPCVIRPAASVDKYQTVAFDRNRYSVPRQFAFQMVTVKGYVDRVVIVAGGQVVATHKRSLKPGPPVLDPLHYLPTLGHKPGALDHAPVYRDWKLPACFTAVPHRAGTTLRGAVPARGGSCGSCNCMLDHPLDRVRQAVEACRREQLISAEAVIQRTRTLAACESQTRRSSSWTTELTTAPQVNVPLPDLSRFNHLLDGPASSEGPDDEGFAVAAAEAACESQVTVFFT